MNVAATPADEPARSVAERELINSLGWLIRMRWFAGTAVIGAALFSGQVLHLHVPEATACAVGVGIFAYNTLFRFALRRINTACSAVPLA